MTDESPLDLTQSLRQLSALLLSREPLADRLQQITSVAAETVRTDGLSITLVPGGRASTVAAADELSLALDRLQYELDDGPCLDGLRINAAIVVEDMRDESRWGAFPDRASTEHGLRSSMSLPLFVDDEVLGIMNFYALTPRRYDESQRRAGLVFAEQAAVVLATAVRMSGQDELAEQLHNAMSSRAVINQAMGILMAQQSCTPDEAFDLLRRASQGRNVKLREIAQELVTRYSGRSGTASTPPA